MLLSGSPKAAVKSHRAPVEERKTPRKTLYLMKTLFQNGGEMETLWWATAKRTDCQEMCGKESGGKKMIPDGGTDLHKGTKNAKNVTFASIRMSVKYLKPTRIKRCQQMRISTHLQKMDGG